MAVTTAVAQDIGELAEPIRLTANRLPIDVPGFAAPFFGDIDGDGKGDLLVGQLDHGKLRIYRNVGTNRKPEFSDFSWFQAGGRVASVPTGCAVGFTPQLTDLDCDGDLDLVTGSFHGAVTYVFRRGDDGLFAEAEVITNVNGEPQLTPKPYNSTVFATDWDGDGDHDLLIGRSTIHVVPNIGTREKPEYGTASRLLVNGEPLPVGRVPPVVADWDADGSPDLITGRKNDVVWYRNTNPKGSPPRFEPARVLLAASAFDTTADEGPDDQRMGPGEHPYSVCVADFDADGQLDLLLGDHYFRRRTLTDEQLAEYKEANRKRSRVIGEYRNLIKESPGLSPSKRVAAFRLALSKWYYISRRHFDGPQAANRNMERHGGIWFYRRLAKTPR